MSFVCKAEYNLLLKLYEALSTAPDLNMHDEAIYAFPVRTSEQDEAASTSPSSRSEQSSNAVFTPCTPIADTPPSSADELSVCTRRDPCVIAGRDDNMLLDIGQGVSPTHLPSSSMDYAMPESPSQKVHAGLGGCNNASTSPASGKQRSGFVPVTPFVVDAYTEIDKVWIIAITLDGHWG